jgi:endonuclease/exonuclease/phosphatase family metal-dependent hydrolase
MNNFLSGVDWCCNKIIEPLYQDIKYKDYFEPIKRFSKENNDIFNNIINKKIIDDTVMMYYIKSSKDVSIIMFSPKALNQKDTLKKVIRIIEKNGDIHYMKDIIISYNAELNLIYQLYAQEKRMKTIGNIMYKAERLGFLNDGIKRTIKIIVYTHMNKDKPINGSSSVFKQELREYFTKEDIKLTPFKENDDRYPRGYDYIHISDTINQVYEYSGIFFNDNSLKFLERQHSWKIMEMKKSIIIFNKIKKFFYDYTQMELEKLLIFSSGVLYTYGIREANDLDCILLESDKIKPELIEKINKEDIDISYKGTKEYNSKWEAELNGRARIFGAKDYNELVLNPKYYYYFMGVKILRLKYDVILRLKRMRPAQFTDLLVVRQMFNLNYKLEIPTESKVYNEVVKKDDIKKVDRKKYIETIQFYLKTRYYIRLSIEQIKEWIKMTYIEDKDNDISITDQSAGSDSMFDKLENIADKKYVYPTQEELISMGYGPYIKIYSSDKPYLYPGEDFTKLSVERFCNTTSTDFKPKFKALRVASFNLHNFISRCNQGLAPLFGTALNPFENPRDIKKFINLFKKVDADIICLQELIPITNEIITEDITDLKKIRSDFNFEYFNKLMTDLGYKYKVIGSTQTGKFYDMENNDYYFLANGIYSKIKLEDEEVYGYKYINRNIIKASVTFNGKKINIYNVHMEYFTTTNMILKNMGINMDQVTKSFQDFANLLKGSVNNVIVCGDFNIDIYMKKNSKRYNNWEKKTKYFRENFNSINKIVIPTNFSQNEKTDFILLKKNSSGSTDIKSIYSYTVFTNISDHYLLFSDFI